MDAPASPPATIAALLERTRVRAGSLIITVFGDTVVPRGGSIWLGSLIRLMAAFTMSERLVRTGVYRLSREGWLASHSRGRKAYYHLTPSGIATFAEADRRIYAAEGPPWDGDWTLLHMAPALTGARRQALKAHLDWSGYGQLCPNLFIHTGRRPVPGLAGPEAVVFYANLAGQLPAAAPRDVAALAWDLDRLNAAYATFTASFAGFEPAFASSEDAFILVTLMIHEYRRILLRDPQLPGELLPPGWAGHGARDLAARLYRRHAEAAGRFVSTHMESWQGLAPDPSSSYFERFGGHIASPARGTGNP